MIISPYGDALKRERIAAVESLNGVRLILQKLRPCIMQPSAMITGRFQILTVTENNVAFCASFSHESFIELAEICEVRLKSL